MTGNLTRHARDRMTARNVPIGIIGLLIDYGEPTGCRDGGIAHAFTASSLRAIKRDYGPAISKALAAHRQAYLVTAGDQVLTVAHARPGSGRRRQGRKRS